jgi:hypothetical protein
MNVSNKNHARASPLSPHRRSSKIVSFMTPVTSTARVVKTDEKKTPWFHHLMPETPRGSKSSNGFFGSNKKAATPSDSKKRYKLPEQVITLSAEFDDDVSVLSDDEQSHVMKIFPPEQSLIRNVVIDEDCNPLVAASLKLHRNDPILPNITYDRFADTDNQTDSMDGDVAMTGS